MLDSFLEQLKLRGLAIKYDAERGLILTGNTKKEATPEILQALKAFKKDLLEMFGPERQGETCKKCEAVVFEPQEVGKLCFHTNFCPYWKGWDHGPDRKADLQSEALPKS